MIRTGNRFRIRFQKKVAKNVTATLTAAELGKGIITSTSVAPVTLTLPTGTSIGGSLKAAQGDKYDFTVDNSVGASVVTLAVNTGIVVPTTIVITGSATLAVAAGQVGLFKLYFKTATTAILFRAS